MRAADIMTTTLLTLSPDLSVGQAARMIAARGVSGAPVLDGDGRLVGMLTEGDLIRRLAAPTDQPQSWLSGLLGAAPAQAAHFARSHGRRVGDVMTAPVTSVAAETPVASIAALLERRGIRRVPVTDASGVLLGIVSRADLVKATLAEPAAPAAAGASDQQIAAALARAMREQPWVDAYWIFPEVRDGVVAFHGFCRSEAVQRALRVLAEAIPGVREVRLDTAPTPAFLLGVP
jgi:CBS domain-containing protein